MDQSPDGSRPGTSSVIEGKTLVIAMESNIETMDPSKTSAMYGPPSMVYETLITRDKSGAYAPGLAESWELRSMSGTGYPFQAVFNMTLKQGVKFHDGSSFNSSAVKRVIDYYVRNDSWIQYQFWSVYGSVNKTGWPDAGIWCKDDHHMTLNLTWRDVALEFCLSNLYGSIMSPDALDADGPENYGTPGYNAVGTGPFMLYEWVAGDHVTLIKNPNYTWGMPWYTNKGPAKIDKVIFRTVEPRSTRFLAYEEGSINVLQQVPPSKIPVYLADPQTTLISGPGQGEYYVCFNCQKSPWDNVSLRKAFGYAINRTHILSSVWHGVGEEGVNYLPPIEAESRRVPAEYNFSYDVSRALDLFAEAGYIDSDSDTWLEDGMGNELTLQLWTTNLAEEVSMSLLLEYDFERIGVHVTLTQYSLIQLRTLAASGLHDSILFWYSWPRAEILDWMLGTWAMGGSNSAWFSDEVFDGYVTNWTYAETEDQFSDNATSGHIRLLTQAPWAPVLYWNEIDAVHTNVTGWYVNPYGLEQVFDILDVDITSAPAAIAIVSPNPAMAGELVTFDASGSRDDAEIVNWTWRITLDLGMILLFGEVATCTFADDFQTWNVSLTVRDSDGLENSSVSTLEVMELVPEFSKSLVPVLGIMALVILIGSRRRRWLRD